MMKNIGRVSIAANNSNELISYSFTYNLDSFANFDVLLFDQSTISIDLASRLSIDQDFDILNNVTELSDSQIITQTFSGKSRSVYQIKEHKKYILILSKSFTITAQMDVKDINVSLDFSGEKATIISIAKNENSIPLTEAKIVVGAGRGMKDPSNWGIIEDLASKLGAGLACSKPVSDLNWRPHHEHVGQTGFKISPKLYIACGISGAIQHLAGVNGSEIIVVINSDPEAPFVKNADYAIIGDLFEVVPALLKNIN